MTSTRNLWAAQQGSIIQTLESVVTDSGYYIDVDNIPITLWAYEEGVTVVGDELQNVSVIQGHPLQ